MRGGFVHGHLQTNFFGMKIINAAIETTPAGTSTTTTTPPTDCDYTVTKEDLLLGEPIEFADNVVAEIENGALVVR